MNGILKQALIGIIKMFIGNKPWEQVREAVQSASQSTGLSGAEKRALVIASIKKQGWTMAGHILNLAIEVAVAVLIKKATELEKK
jgi:hypothetical protein